VDGTFYGAKVASLAEIEVIASGRAAMATTSLTTGGRPDTRP
jgi:hypothetical protein